jgi:CubicO group peptidase (beta-lactamase class C family)
MAVVICFLTGTVAGAQGDSIDRYIRERMESLRIPGLSLAVLRDHKITRSRGYGFANIESGVPATAKTVYEIGSMTKQFTAMAIMMLVEDGRLHLDDRLESFFPGTPTSWKGITIRHMLTHTSGIRNHVAIPGYMDLFRMSLGGDVFPKKEEILKGFFLLPLEFRQGESWAYDNTGYYLLGLIIEQLSGQSYWAFLDQRIFTPLGMKATRNTDTKPIVTHRASGYVWMGTGFQNQPPLWPFVGFSAGSLMSSVEDLARWDEALYTDKLVKRSSLSIMWEAATGKGGALLPSSYGFGWFVDSYHGHRIVQHSGGTPGFSSVIYRFPDDTLTIILLTNHADKMIDQLAIEIAGMYQPGLGRPLQADDPMPARTDRLKNIFSGLLEGRHDEKEFTPAMAAFLKTSTGKSFWQWFASAGAPGTFIFSDAEINNGITTLRYRIMLGKDQYLFTFRINQEGRIAQINFS